MTATAAAQGLTVATRDTAPFAAMALDVIDSWS
ncbi:putative nucleic acid-binding protein [Xanthomonas campestris]|nr:type II toxin-antitoxin system VapC family toxin [Xanthomonas sp. CFBP 8151]MEB1609770.1 type II toxin-antitoxin system VapC family toxin [Xanthomonas campestris pv. campestris]NIJ77744.1 putative nucleic acid-binding protein [Xanthomonas sp. CFBP 8151]